MTSTTEGASARILQAADDLFAARGYAGVSIRDIAERAGVAKGLVFYHFGSKAELFEQILEHYYQRHAAALAAGAAEGGDRRERLHHMLDAYLDFLEENRSYVQLVQRELGTGSEATGAIRRGLGNLYGWVSEILEGLVPEAGPLAARHFFVSFSGLAITYYLYAPVMEGLFGEDPMQPARRRERRAHVHWLLDTAFDRLLAEADARAAKA